MAACAAVLACIAVDARADTVASLLGNFTINQFCGLQLSSQSVQVHYAVVFGQLPALRELHLADANGDGVTSQAERDAYVGRLATRLAAGLSLRVDGAAVPLHLTHWASSLPVEQGGFSLRLDAEFSAPVPRATLTGTHTVSLANANYQGRLGWHEIAVQAAPSIHVFKTNAFSTSLTAGLTEALKTLPPGGPLDERAVHLSFTRGPPPAHSVPLQPRPVSVVAAASVRQARGAGQSAWLQVQTRRLIELISAPRLEPRVVLLTLLFALALGSVHALSPGHGKTLVGAYLIGSRGTPRHALFLGVTVTVTHTLGVFVLGFATLFASRFLVPETLFPVLSLISGLLVFGMGMILLARRWHGARRTAREGSPPHDHAHAHAGEHMHSAVTPEHGLVHSHGGVVHSHGDLVHSHGGGSVHSHFPAGADPTQVSWRSLLALGVSGGLLPCPSAMVLLLAAVALKKTAYGLVLVVVFSLGLAASLTLVGLAFLYARSRIRRIESAGRWAQLLPILSAALITVIGALLCFNALQGAPFANAAHAEAGRRAG